MKKGGKRIHGERDKKTWYYNAHLTMPYRSWTEQDGVHTHKNKWLIDG